MVKSLWQIRRVLGVLFVLLVSACATHVEKTSSTQDTFAEPAAAEVIAVGLDSIADKYIETVDIVEVGVEGLRGLGAIDANVTLQRHDGEMTLFDNGLEIGRMGLPPKEDTRAWAAAMVALTETARKHSPEIRHASPEKIYEAIFDGALSDLDIFSRYAGTAQARRNRAKREGFGGIGIRFRLANGSALVTKVLKDTPAQKTGIRVGDLITEVDGENVRALKSRDITKLIRGPVHTDVKITLARSDAVQPFTVDVPRAHIVPETVFMKIENNIAIIRIKSFNQNTANSLEKTLTKLSNATETPLLGIVLDMRGNPGGLLRQSVKVADMLLTQGDILRTVGRHPDSLHHYRAGGGDIASGLPLVVLVDGKSASAAEIVAAALQDRDRAVVVGTASYGKGSVQTVIRLPNDGEITLTWSRFVAPSGYYLHGLGVVPTVCTSGHASLDEASGIIEAALSAKASRFAETWQRRGLLSDEERQSLRDDCPSEKRSGPLDIEIAKRLILDGQLHSRALRLTTATAQAIN